MNSQTKSLRDVRELLSSELSLASRLGYVALGLGAAMLTVIIVSLWTSEPDLPARTHWAFAAMSAIGISWIALATWALTTRRILPARDRVIAGWMAVTFTAVFLLGTVLATIISGGKAWTAVVMGLVLLALAVRALLRARRRFAELASRRAELERQLGGIEPRGP
jgi:hypothetical protein